jgi:hypothetical protein
LANSWRLSEVTPRPGTKHMSKRGVARS